MKCPNCGKEIANDSQFCECCGAKINLVPTCEQRLKSKKSLLITLAVILCLSIFGGILYHEHKETEAAHAEAQSAKEHAELLYKQLESKQGVTQNNYNDKKNKSAEDDFSIGETWSYTGHSNWGNATTYFVFTPRSEVVWLLGTPFGNVFPMGCGKYDSKTGDVTFSATNARMHRICDEPIVFNIDRKNRKAVHTFGGDWLNIMYNDGHDFAISKVKRKLAPSKKLIGSTWRSADNKYEIYFKTANEAVFTVESDTYLMGYICIGNMLSIKTGDDIGDENMIGDIINGNEVTLCREGLDKARGNFTMTLFRE